jgi:hypothetical protein
MEVLLWVAVIILLSVIVALSIKIYLLKKSALEIKNAFHDKLVSDTNTLVTISSRDRNMTSLASSINGELRLLRKERHRFLQGDMELKNAVTNISHDLRTPLTAIFGYLDLLDRQEKNEESARYINIIRSRAETMAQLTDELFRYTIIVTENKNNSEPVVINSVLEDSIAAFYALLSERNITPNIIIPEKKVTKNLDRSSLSRIFSNLINNAVKYSDGDLEITMTENGKITFTNTAKGLDEVQVGKLFDRFYTVETAKDSTGLGLAIARTLIGNIGGSISAEYKDYRLSITVQLPD